MAAFSLLPAGSLSIWFLCDVFASSYAIQLFYNTSAGDNFYADHESFPYFASASGATECAHGELKSYP